MANGNSYIHAYADCYIYAYRNGYNNSYGNSDCDCDGKPAAHTHATASAYTAASPLALLRN